jgi:hypothetical protein
VAAAAFAVVTPACTTQQHVCAEQRNYRGCLAACESGDRAACVAGQRIASKVCDGDASDPYFDGSLSTRSVEGACKDAERLQRRVEALPK